MWVLVLAIASFLAFFSIVPLLWLAKALESRNIQHKRRGCLEQPFTFLSINHAFEPTFAPLWEAPIHGLELMKSAGAQGIPVSRLRPIFNKTAVRFPEMYDGYSFEQWLQFLEDTELACWTGHKFVLTPRGREFLVYRFMTESLLEA
jgi:hypothetical protein